MHISFKKHIGILPLFGQLDTIPNSTRLLMLANSAYIGKITSKRVYDWFSNYIANSLFDDNVINAK